MQLSQLKITTLLEAWAAQSVRRWAAIALSLLSVWASRTDSARLAPIDYLKTGHGPYCPGHCRGSKKVNFPEIKSEEKEKTRDEKGQEPYWLRLSSLILFRRKSQS